MISPRWYDIAAGLLAVVVVVWFLIRMAGLYSRLGGV